MKTTLWRRTPPGDKSSGNGYVLTAANDGVMSVTYANAIVAEQSNFVFRCFGGICNYTQAVVTITDAANADNAVQAVFRQVDGKVWFFVGGKSYRTDYSFVGKSFDISLGFENGAFVYDGAAFAPVETVIGDKFTGFDSDKVYLSFELTDAKKGDKFSVMSIRKYKFEGQDEDLGSPVYSDKRRSCLYRQAWRCYSHAVDKRRRCDLS